MRAAGFDGNNESPKHGKCSLVRLPVLSMTWLQGYHDHFRYRLGIRFGSQTTNSPGDLVAKLLAGDDGNFLTHPLVSMEIAAQPGVIFLDDDPGGLLHRLGPDSSL